MQVSKQTLVFSIKQTDDF